MSRIMDNLHIFVDLWFEWSIIPSSVLVLDRDDTFTRFRLDHNPLILQTETLSN
jgi:hypothetical protein